MIITLRVLTNIESKPDKKGKTKVIKRNVEYLRQFETNSILAEQYVSRTGKIGKRWCFVKEGDQYFRVNHRFEEIRRITEPVEVKGFR